MSQARVFLGIPWHSETEPMHEKGREKTTSSTLLSVASQLIQNRDAAYSDPLVSDREILPPRSAHGGPTLSLTQHTTRVHDKCGRLTSGLSKPIPGR